MSTNVAVVLNDEAVVQSPVVAVKRGRKAGNPNTKLAQAKRLYASATANGLTKRSEILPILEKELELKAGTASLYFHFARVEANAAAKANAEQAEIFAEAVAEATV